MHCLKIIRLSRNSVLLYLLFSKLIFIELKVAIIELLVKIGANQSLDFICEDYDWFGKSYISVIYICMCVHVCSNCPSLFCLIRCWF